MSKYQSITCPVVGDHMTWTEAVPLSIFLGGAFIVMLFAIWWLNRK